MTIASSSLQHTTVLADAAVTQLVTNPSGLYVDGTFGRGGHSRLLLQRLAPQAQLLAMDRDPMAEAAAMQLTDPRFRFVRTRFSRLAQIMQERQVSAPLCGVLLDLGVSSPQIDDPARGFSFRQHGPLDMRMDPQSGESAAQWLARVTIDELVRVIRDYGEERFAVPIAKAIVASRQDGARAGGALTSTGELAAVVANAVPKSRKTVAGGAQHPATRTFQAIRIHINQELEELALTLDQAGQRLAPGGRLVVISFHSLEDRLVKRFIDAHSHPERQLVRADARLARLPLMPAQLPPARLQAVARVLPDDAEVQTNPRARSAVMRVAQRTSAAWVSVSAEALQ